MPETKHTPGPWLRYYPTSPSPVEYASVFYGNPDNDLAGLVEYVPKYIPIEQAIAAPELLAALKKIVKYCERSLTLGGCNEKEIQYILQDQRAAINKAEGSHE